MWGLPEEFLQIKAVENFILDHRWVWPLCEMFHFVGLILLVGIVTMVDLRILGVAKRMPLGPLHRLIPWAVLGFVLCVGTGLVFVTGLWANVKTHPMEAIATDQFLQLKLIFILLAGINVVLLYQGGIARKLEAIGPGEDAPGIAKFIGGSSLVLWIGVVYWGRLIPWGL